MKQDDRKGAGIPRLGSVALAECPVHVRLPSRGVGRVLRRWAKRRRSLVSLWVLATALLFAAPSAADDLQQPVGLRPTLGLALYAGTSTSNTDVEPGLLRGVGLDLNLEIGRMFVGVTGLEVIPALGPPCTDLQRRQVCCQGRP